MKSSSAVKASGSRAELWRGVSVVPKIVFPASAQQTVPAQQLFWESAWRNFRVKRTVHHDVYTLAGRHHSFDVAARRLTNNSPELIDPDTESVDIGLGFDVVAGARFHVFDLKLKHFSARVDQTSCRAIVNSN